MWRFGLPISLAGSPHQRNRNVKLTRAYRSVMALSKLRKLKRANWPRLNESSLAKRYDPYGFKPVSVGVSEGSDCNAQENDL